MANYNIPLIFIEATFNRTWKQLWTEILARIALSGIFQRTSQISRRK